MNTIKINKNLGTDSDGNEIIESVVYVAPEPKARMIRNATKMTEQFDVKNLKVADLDALVDFVVELFGNKFTADDIWDGIDAKQCL